MERSFLTPSGSLKISEVYNGSPNNWELYIDVASALPNNYKLLSVENFGVTYAILDLGSGSLAPGTRGIVVDSYNPQTGQLRVYTRGSSLKMTSVTVKCWYV